MALKTQTRDTLERLNDLCEKNGIEIIIPDLTKKEEVKKEEKKEDKKKK